MRIFLILFLLIFTFGCAARDVNYNREKVMKKYLPEFDIYLDLEKVDFKHLYLDKDNIEKTIIDKKSKIVWMSQIEKTALFELKKLSLDSLNSRHQGSKIKEVGLIILDGIPMTENDINKIKIDPNSINVFEILTQEDIVNLNWCKAHEHGIIFIGIK